MAKKTTFCVPRLTAVRVALLALILLVLPADLMARISNPRFLSVKHISQEIPIASLNDPAWQGASQIAITKYWNGKASPAGRHAEARLLWSDTALYVRFDASQNEPLVISEKPDLSRKTRGLWDRDVCEIFIAPDASQRNKYFEFEIAPTGEWIDLGIEVTSQGRKTDWEYASQMTSAARIDKDKVVMAIKIPWAALGARPKTGDIWLGNLFRCVGEDPKRGYLAWQPTKTKEPAFHVPEAFAQFRFTK